MCGFPTGIILWNKNNLKNKVIKSSGVHDLSHELNREARLDLICQCLKKIKKYIILKFVLKSNHVFIGYLDCFCICKVGRLGYIEVAFTQFNLKYKLKKVE